MSDPITDWIKRHRATRRLEDQPSSEDYSATEPAEHPLSRAIRQDAERGGVYRIS